MIKIIFFFQLFFKFISKNNINGYIILNVKDCNRFKIVLTNANNPNNKIT